MSFYDILKLPVGNFFRFEGAQGAQIRHAGRLIKARKDQGEKLHKARRHVRRESMKRT